MNQMVFTAFLIVLVVLLGPLVYIWALNTLFPALAIPYTFYTWVAVIVLVSMVRPELKIR